MRGSGEHSPKLRDKLLHVSMVGAKGLSIENVGFACSTLHLEPHNKPMAKSGG
jgi:hypothetical protein